METSANTGDERAPFEIPLSEKVAEKMKANGVVLPDFLTIGDKVDKKDLEKEDDEGDVKKQSVANARNHYDKEDLISFHQLFISKPLTKAASDLDFEHPTVI
jgi:hypothetical protein